MSCMERVTYQNRHGWVVLDKPLGLTSTQALGKVRKLVGGKKAGHGGTLDPLASGVLPLAFGEATKLIPYVMDSNKTYEFSIRWGEQRATDDAEGDVIATSDCRPSEAQIRAVLPRFIGEIDQTPPAFSAIKIDGQRAYDLARAGEAPVMVSRKIVIYDLQLIGLDGPDEATLRVDCGKGTYVRSLARDLALILGTYGYVSRLRRTKTGAFSLAESISLEKLEELSHKNAAMSAMLGKSNDATHTALDSLYKHMMDHFSYEEELMARAYFPGLADHKKEHEAFVAKINGFMEEYKKNASNTVTIDLVNYVKSWLTDHMLGTDRKYIVYLRAAQAE